MVRLHQSKVLHAELLLGAIAFAIMMLLPIVYITIIDNPIAELESWTPSHISETKRRGQVLIEALDRYKAANSQYPDSLEMIVPRGISQRLDLQPLTGNPEWGYAASDTGEEFHLWFSANNDEYPIAIYDSRSPQWTVDE